jgi:hypothetical protein
MLSSELMIVLLFIAIIWYWLDGVRAKELARHAGRNACAQDHVSFLDDTVVQQKVSLRRNRSGHVVIRRCYDFEFTSDGSCRYKGSIDMLGKTVSHVSLETHRVPPGY